MKGLPPSRSVTVKSQGAIDPSPPSLEPIASLSVVFPVPLHRVFTYTYPATAGPPPLPGTRVVAPLGRRRLVGFVAESGGASPEGVVPKPVEQILDSGPLFSPPLWALAQWIASYYVAPLGMVLRSMLPPGLLRTRAAKAGADLRVSERSRVPPLRKHTLVEPLVLAVPPGLEKRARARARALEALIESAIPRGGVGTPMPVDALSFRVKSGTSLSVLKGLAQEGLVRLHELPDRPAWAEGASPRGESAHPLSDDQRVALDQLVRRLPPGPTAGDGKDPEAGGSDRGGRAVPGSANGGSTLSTEDLQSGAAEAARAPRPVVLHGITASGKTLVYLRLVEEALARGGQAIVLVPEIGLTPRAASRFREVFGDRVALLHSVLSEGERLQAWQAMRAGEVDVAVGPRSAVFAPLARVLVIVVDEEHEASYKQEEAPRYNAREVALVRGRLEPALVVLGSATPSLESYSNARSGKHDLLTLPIRIAGRDLPAVQTIDMRTRGPAERILSNPLREALAEALSRGEQSLLLLNRRGFASYLQCADCGATLHCPNCRITLTLHRPRGWRAGSDLRCHYCDHRESAPQACGSCGSVDLSSQGLGTQQVEELARELFPSARIARMDLDTTARKGSHMRIVEAMERGEIDILVGTQMIAKGHDFPGLSLVGVVSADTGLNFPDFRAAERTFQLVVQVAGRPGRGPTPGRVLVQTYVPDHPAIQAAVRHDYESFYRAEVEARFEAGYAPAVKLARCVLAGRHEERVEGAARALVAQVEELRRERGLEERITGVGPSPAPLSQLRGRFRWHYLVKSTAPSLLEAILHRLATRWRPPRGVQLIIDRDPYNLL